MFNPPRARRLPTAALALLLGCAVPALRADTGAAPLAPAPAAAPSDALYIPNLTSLLPGAKDKESISSSLQILILMTLLMVLPSILLMMTCFVRMIIVLVLLRQALGTQSVPPSQVLVGLALFLTILVMAPTWDKIHRDAVQPYLDGGSQTQAIAQAGGHLRNFMFDQIEAAGNEQDVFLMVEYARQAPLSGDETLRRKDVSLTALIPAYLLSELKVAFILGFRIYLPFLVIDMVISTVLVAMGMMMLPPVLISFPFKLLLFVLADGWHLVGGSLMASVQ